MKKLGIVLTALLLTVTLTGCNKVSKVKQAYNRMVIGSGEENIKGYTAKIKLFGVYKNAKVKDEATVDNYRNSSFKVVLKDVTYYVTQDGDFKEVNGEFTKIEEEVVSEATASEETQTTEEEEKEVFEIPFTELGVYLNPLNKVDDKLKVKGIKEVYENNAYTTYTIPVKKEVVPTLLAHTSLAKEEIVNDITAKIYVTRSGEVARIVYDIASGLVNTYNLELTIEYSNINNVKEIEAPIEIPEEEEEIEEEQK